MKTLNVILLLPFLLIFTNCSTDSASDDLPIDEVTPEQEIKENDPEEEMEENVTYFPPLNSDEWETISLTELEWNEAELEPLLDFLEEKGTKGFIILKNGKIVVESYMNGHSASTPWYWASAGKTLTTTVTGIAVDEDLLDINAKVSDYLGEGWTSAPIEKENLITNKNLLSMNSGLDDSLGDNVSPSNLQYVADAGERWAYHNVYAKLQDVVAAASEQDWSTYFEAKLKHKIGMNGSWIANNDLSVYWSNTRSMARFGLFIQADGQWEDQQLISKEFLEASVNTSQDINEAYGYLWWLNGKSSYHLPSSQFEFDGALIPTAPTETIAALGKNDQKIYIVPSEKLVVIRMGNVASDVNFALSSFDEELWSKLNDLMVK